VAFIESPASANSRFPEGMTERKAKAEADPYGMTARKAKTKARAEARLFERALFVEGG
jgi:hypothetical protein